MHAVCTIMVSKVVVFNIFASKSWKRTWKFTVLTSRSQPSGDIIGILLLAAAFWVCMVNGNSCGCHDFGLTGRRLFLFCLGNREKLVNIIAIDVSFAAFWGHNPDFFLRQSSGYVG